MAYSEVAPISKQMTIVTGLSVVGLMAFGLALSYYKNVIFDRQLAVMQQRNMALKNEITDGYEELQYLQSVQYKDKYAKENLGLLRQGEKALLIKIVDQEQPLTTSLAPTEEEKAAIYEENLRNIRIIDHWKMYLFERSKIEGLKKAV